jgi:hypothetical protein
MWQHVMQLLVRCTVAAVRSTTRPTTVLRQPASSLPYQTPDNRPTTVGQQSTVPDARQLSYNSRPAVRSTRRPTTVLQQLASSPQYQTPDNSRPVSDMVTTDNAALQQLRHVQNRTFLAFPYTIISPHYNFDSNSTIW